MNTQKPSVRRPVARALAPALMIGLGLLLAGCEEGPPRRPVAHREPVVDEAPAPPQVYFYPTQGQSPEQQDRDRFECYSWAVKQTGFDPGRQLPPQERVTVVPARAPGETTVGAAIVGALIGAAVSSPGHAGGGAIVGAAAGGLLGAAAEGSQAEQVRRIESSRGDSRYRRASSEFRRAMSACLEGRGYSVK
jgi:hypothetical protein